MTMQFSTPVRNAALDGIEAVIGTSVTLEIRTGTAPANCAVGDSGTVLATIALPSDWMAAAAAGSKTLLGSWIDAAADATGVAGHFRIKAGGACHIQGTASQRAADGGAGDLQLDQATAGLVAGQTFSVTAFTLTMGGA